MLRMQCAGITLKYLLACETMLQRFISIAFVNGYSCLLD